MTEYEKFLERKQAEYGERFVAPWGANLFARFLHSPTRIRVVTTYPSGDTYERTGTVGITTGWHPSFLLMHRRGDHGSSDVIDERDSITAVQWDGRTYEPVSGPAYESSERPPADPPAEAVSQAVSQPVSGPENQTPGLLPPFDSADAYMLGYDEGLGECGMTYDDDPESQLSRAYDAGRTVRRVLEGWEDMPPTPPTPPTDFVVWEDQLLARKHMVTALSADEARSMVEDSDDGLQSEQPVESRVIEVVALDGGIEVESTRVEYGVASRGLTPVPVIVTPTPAPALPTAIDGADADDWLHLQRNGFDVFHGTRVFHSLDGEPSPDLSDEEYQQLIDFLCSALGLDSKTGSPA
jgi:hypothetical protein